MSDFTHRPQIEDLSAADGVRRRPWLEDKLRIVEESSIGYRQAAATARDCQVEIALVNGRRLVVSAGVDPGALARLLSVVQRR